ncbi:hypothetical protein BIW11_10324 [Tropilaelaps mercedesae]|uniref:Pseudouridine synthase II N-terminal domain-containing protein n=1 Tax=Tropilaelaps mercedesae TaxID=418985 RepID=A0A1V9XGM6_9ACAR|nr:hypothetical protein BIW11_10324 [Tropilaelaps mercedesae]
MIRTYHIDCLLGIATDTGRSDGKVIDRSKYHHVTPALIERLLGSIQSSYRTQAFLYAKVMPDSEEAYKLVSSGLVRPESKYSPGLIYSLRCIDLQPPKFILELQVLNESEAFLCRLIHYIGIKLRTAAVAERFRVMRFGPFTADMALLQRNWRLEHILNNIQKTNRKVDEIRYSGLFGKPTPGKSLLQVVNE